MLGALAGGAPALLVFGWTVEGAGYLVVTVGALRCVAIQRQRRGGRLALCVWWLLR